MYPRAIEKLIASFKILPGIGDKTAERLVLHLVKEEQSKLEDFANNLLKATTEVKQCSQCHFITDQELCSICSSDKRDKTVVCVVESIRDVVVLEKLKTFNGLYHVLNGAISPIDGVLIDDLNIASLIKRLQQNPQITEVILATNPSIDGEATASYIANLLADTSLTVSRIAHGLPVGSDLEYADELTLFKALEGRKTYKD